MSVNQSTKEKVYTTNLLETNDGTGDCILEFPDAVIEETGWKEGTVLNLEVRETPSGNVLVITEKK